MTLPARKPAMSQRRGRLAAVPQEERRVGASPDQARVRRLSAQSGTPHCMGVSDEGRMACARRSSCSSRRRAPAGSEPP